MFDLALCCGPNAHNSVQPLGSYGVVHNTRTYTQRMAYDGEQREVNLPNRWHTLNVPPTETTCFVRGT